MGLTNITPGLSSLAGITEGPIFSISDLLQKTGASEKPVKFYADLLNKLASEKREKLDKESDAGDQPK